MEEVGELAHTLYLDEDIEVVEAEVKYFLEVVGVGLGKLVVDKEAAVVGQKVENADEAASFFIGGQRVDFGGDQSQQVIAGEPGLPAVGGDVVVDQPADVLGFDQLPVLFEEVGELVVAVAVDDIF